MTKRRESDLGAEFSAKTPLAIKRGNKRRRTIIPAKLLSAGGELDVRLRDLSRSGALGEADRPPVEQSQVVLVFGSAVVPAIVAWVLGKRFGLEFDTLLRHDELPGGGGPRLG
jgi:hypothetical protein